jgi:hypothetical protein
MFHILMVEMEIKVQASLMNLRLPAWLYMKRNSRIYKVVLMKIGLFGSCLKNARNVRSLRATANSSHQ